ncbi:hypothetical protein D3C86_1648230 [compost metagenome]
MILAVATGFNFFGTGALIFRSNVFFSSFFLKNRGSEGASSKILESSPERLINFNSFKGLINSIYFESISLKNREGSASVIFPHWNLETAYVKKTSFSALVKAT